MAINALLNLLGEILPKEHNQAGSMTYISLIQ
jgi:hypothetical protein